MFISFIIPTYNIEKYINKSLQSVLNQTDKDFEIIVVDDGSSDKTVEVARKILSETNVNYKIITKDNGGPGSARNLGLRESKGEYVIFLDGDDYVSPYLVEEIKKNLDKTPTDVIIWKFLMVDEFNKPLKKQLPFETKKNYEIVNGLDVLRDIVLEKKLWVWTASAAYSRDYIISKGLFFDEKYNYGEDLEFEWKVLLINPKVLLINKVLSFYVQRSNSLTKRASLKNFEFYIILKQFCERLKEATNKDSNLLKQAITEWMIFNFINNYILYLKNTNDKNIFDKLEKRYPDLPKIVLSDMNSLGKFVSKISLKKKIIFLLFKASPKKFATFYLFYLKLKKKVLKYNK